MDSLLGQTGPAGPDGAPLARGAPAWQVNGVRYANTAAKFWSALFDEAAEAYPTCDSLVLEAAGEQDLRPRLLNPLAALEDALALPIEDVRGELADTLAMLSLVGPPAAVRVRVLAGTRELAVTSLPTACVDEEIMPTLTAWLLHWAEVPGCLWNLSQVAGRFAATTVDGRRYAVRLELENTPLSEGLVQRRLVVRY